MKEFIDMRSLPRDARHDRREQVVLLRKAGRSYTEIARETGLSRTGAFNICKRYDLRGDKALTDQPTREFGDGRFLKSAQETEVRRLILERMPNELDLGVSLWSRAAVQEIVERRFGVKLAVRTMALYMRRWGFVRQMPAEVSLLEYRDTFLSRFNAQYSSVAALASAQGAEIHWCRTTNLTADADADLSLFMLSTTTNRGQLRWRLMKTTPHDEVLIDFLLRLLQEIDRKVYLIPDAPLAFRSKTVRAWLAAHKRSIDVFDFESVDGIKP